MNESAVAAAARLALQSNPPAASAIQRPRRTRFLELGLAGTTVVLLILVWRQYTIAPAAHPSAVAMTDVTEDVRPADAEALEQAATKVPDEAVLPPARATVPALETPLPDKQPRVADFAATNADYATAETYDRAVDLPASEFAVAPDGADDDVGEIAPSRSGSEIDVIEVDEGGSEAKTDVVEADKAGSQGVGAATTRSKPVVTTAASKAASQVRPKKTSSTGSKKSVQATDFGDCAMPSWAWRVFGFTEEKIKPSC